MKKNNPIYSNYSDDYEIWHHSSRGTKNGRKPDLVSPGCNIKAPNAKGSLHDLDTKTPHIGSLYIIGSGTSFSSPIIAGICALLLQKNPDITPQKIKEILLKTAERLSYIDEIAQGSGMPNPLKAITETLTKP